MNAGVLREDSGNLDKMLGLPVKDSVQGKHLLYASTYYVSRRKKLPNWYLFSIAGKTVIDKQLWNLCKPVCYPENPFYGTLKLGCCIYMVAYSAL